MLVSLLKHHISTRSTYKVIVFFTTARLCQCMAEIGSRSGIGEVLGSMSYLFDYSLSRFDFNRTMF